MRTCVPFSPSRAAQSAPKRDLSDTHCQHPVRKRKQTGSPTSESDDAPPPGERGPRGDRPFPRPPGPPFGHPVMAALDADKDGSLSADEIAKASEALNTLDTNKDGKLTEDELRPPRLAGPTDRPSWNGEDAGALHPMARRAATVRLKTVAAGGEVGPATSIAAPNVAAPKGRGVR